MGRWRRGWRDLVRKLALAGVGLALGLILAEGALRLWSGTGAEGLVYGAPQAMPPDAYQGDAALFQVPTPGFEGEVATLEYRVHLRFNALGLRGGPVRQRGGVLLLGDSFALGAQVAEEQSLAGQLQARLGVPVHNAGVDGYSTWQATGRYTRLAGDLDPDTVLLLYFLGNDLEDNHRFPESRGAVYTPKVTDPPGWFTRHSALLAAGRSLLRAGALRDRDSPERTRYLREIAPFTRTFPDVLPTVLPMTRAALTALRDAAADQGDRLLVAVAPPAFALGRADATFRLLGLSPADEDLDAPRQAVLGVLDSLGVAACDLSPALREEGASAYYVFDGHWTAAGHAAAAGAVVGCLTGSTAPGPTIR